MSNSRKNATRQLYEIAENQNGFFTTKQALHAGFSARSHLYHVQTRDWVREYRGIYRLAQFPPTERPDLMRWYLWSRNKKDKPEGVYSHETALSLYDLSDVMPAKLHMTVPKGFRRSSPIPRALILHWANLHDRDIADFQGVEVVKPLPTIVTLLTEGKTSRDLLIQALRDGLRRGLVTQAAIKENFPSAKVDREFRALLKQARSQ